MSGYRLTRTSTWVLTAIAAVLYIVLCWLFADGLLTGTGEPTSFLSSPVLTWLLLLIIIAAGAYQATRLPAEGLTLVLPHDDLTPGQTDDPRWWRLLTGNVYWALLWLPFRFFVGRDWITHGWDKLGNPAWMDGSGKALAGYWTNAVRIPEEGRPPITYDWYRQFLQYMLDNNWAPWFSKVIVFGEILVGLGILVGALVGLAAFFGTVLNLSFGLAGTASTNPVLFGLSVLLVLAWRVAGWWGFDRWILPVFGIRPNPEAVGRAVAAAERRLEGLRV